MQFPDLDPVALQLGPLVLRWYALAYMGGFLLGWWYALWFVRRDPDKRPSPPEIEEYMPWAVAGVILGGRFGYVLFYQTGYYLSHPLEILKVWHGGMSFHGGALGVILSLLVFAAVKKISPRRMADVICCAVPIGLLLGRIANFINGELYGRVTDVSWGMVFPGGGDLPRHPSQLYEAALEGLLLFTALFLLARRQFIRDHAGILTGVFLAGYGLCRSFVELFREPDQQLGLFFGLVSMGQLLSLPMILGGAYLVYYSYRWPPR